PNPDSGRPLVEVWDADDVLTRAARPTRPIGDFDTRPAIYGFAHALAVSVRAHGRGTRRGTRVGTGDCDRCHERHATFVHEECDISLPSRVAGDPDTARSSRRSRRPHTGFSGEPLTLQLQLKAIEESSRVL